MQRSYNGFDIGFEDNLGGQTKEAFLKMHKKNPAFKGDPQADKILGEIYDDIAKLDVNKPAKSVKPTTNDKPAEGGK